jgi:hypothetical protein
VRSLQEGTALSASEAATHPLQDNPPSADTTPIISKENRRSQYIISPSDNNSKSNGKGSRFRKQWYS